MRDSQDPTFTSTSSSDSYGPFIRGLTADNLWTYLINVHSSPLTPDKEIKIDSVFKSKNPKKYIQVKTSLINNGT